MGFGAATPGEAAAKLKELRLAVAQAAAPAVARDASLAARVLSAKTLEEAHAIARAAGDAAGDAAAPTPAAKPAARKRESDAFAPLVPREGEGSSSAAKEGWPETVELYRRRSGISETSRAVAFTGLSTSWPRRRRDPPPRTTSAEERVDLAGTSARRTRARPFARCAF